MNTTATNNSRALRSLAKWLRSCESSARIDELDAIGGKILSPPWSVPAEYVTGQHWPIIRCHVQAIENDMTAAMSKPKDKRKTATRNIDIDPAPHREALENLEGPTDDELDDFETLDEALERMEKPENPAHERRIARIACHAAAIPKTIDPKTGAIDIAYGIDWHDLNR